MSKSLLCLVAFTCLVSMVMAQYTYITQSLYTDSACLTTPSHSIFNSTNVATSGVTFIGYNCDTTGRAFKVQYTDATSFTAYSYSQLGAMACQPSAIGFVTYNCSVTSSTTAKPAPISFPASSDGWITSQTWYLASNGNIADKCNSETAKTTYILNSATQSGVCSAYGTKSTTTPAGYSMSFCSSNSAYEGAAMFDVADTTCVNEPLKFAVGPTGRCDGGTISTCDAGSASLFPSSMPSIGSVNYDQADTTCALPFIGASLFMESKCVNDGNGNSEMFVCASQFVNKTIPAGTWSQWSGNTACTGTANVVTQIAQDFDPSNAAPSNCQNTQSFTCHFEFPAAASTITISFCTMIVAIFVALFGKQL